jgi:hypothetical protein
VTAQEAQESRLERVGGGRPRPRWRWDGAAWRRRATAPWVPLALAVAALAQRAISGVLTKVGHAAASLDDTYIHFQYARAIAEGHPLRFYPGAPVTTGATSLLWPVALAPFWLCGAREDALVWAAWALSFLALGGLAWEAAKLAGGLAGRAAAVGAGALVLSCGGLVWSAASGMEVVPFAWLVARTARRAAEWAESPIVERTPRREAELVVLAWASACMRPEGALFALWAAATLATFRCARDKKTRAASALVAAVAAVAPALLSFALTGSWRSSTATAKLLPGNPYYAGAALTAAVEANLRLFFGTLLDGQVWSAEFLPSGGAAVAVAGLVAVAWMGRARALRWRAAAVLLVAAATLAPCFYVTFLWNRLRYLWPFATGWIVGLACLARLAGDLAATFKPRWRLATPLACGVLVGLFASKLPWVIDDVAQSASGIDRQQVALGRWAKRALAPDARIGVNDTGAIAYFGAHPTFDVVGLTTPGEARYWIAGPASRFEHYERLARSAPALLPTHFIVYPEWLAIDAILGRSLQEATVVDSTILGGKTMRAYEADWSLLGSGEEPWTPARGAIVDALDVADLESEREHAYPLLDARDGEEVVHEGVDPAGRPVVDGGRSRRRLDRFRARLRPGEAARLIVRFAAEEGTRVRVFVGDEELGSLAPPGDDGWTERELDLPPGAVTANTPIALRASGEGATTFHYWLVQ